MYRYLWTAGLSTPADRKLVRIFFNSRGSIAVFIRTSEHKNYQATWSPTHCSCLLRKAPPNTESHDHGITNTVLLLQRHPPDTVARSKHGFPAKSRKKICQIHKNSAFSNLSAKKIETRKAYIFRPHYGQFWPNNFWQKDTVIFSFELFCRFFGHLARLTAFTSNGISPSLSQSRNERPSHVTINGQ